MFYKIAMILFIFVASTSVLSAAPDVTGPAVPQNLHVFDALGNTYVDHAPHGCSGKTFLISADHVKYNAIVSILLAAQISGKRVALRYDGCNTAPQGLVVGVYLQD